MTTTTILALLALSSLCFAVCGDCDGDGSVTVLDALEASRQASGITTATVSCDVAPPVAQEGDIPVVDILDALLIAQAAVGMPVVLVCP